MITKEQWETWIASSSINAFKTEFDQVFQVRSCITDAWYVKFESKNWNDAVEFRRKAAENEPLVTFCIVKIRKLTEWVA